MSESWQSLAQRSTYAILRDAKGGYAKHTTATARRGYDEMIGWYGKIDNKSYIDNSTNPKFSINTDYRPPGTGSKPLIPHHNWVYPTHGDVIEFYDAHGCYIATWRNGPSGSNPDQTKETFTEEAGKLFKANTSKAKGGYRAIVEYNGTVVWESDQVYTDDDNFQAADPDMGVKQVGDTGMNKAAKAAQSAINQVVESLFAKVTVK